jgi:hypothetical protein
MASEGGWRFEFFSTISATNCNLVPTQTATVETTANALACRPNWWVDGTGTHHHVPEGVVYIYIPSGMWTDLIGPATTAVTRWESELPGVNVDFEITPNDCSAYGSSCIMVDEDHPGDGCAGTTPFGSDPWELKLKSNWRDALTNGHTTRLERTVGHELGHAAGLAHSDCTDDESIMAETPILCDASASGMTIEPLEPDVRPTVSSTYGDGNRKLCGF